NDGVQVELLEQFFLDPRAHAIAKECAIRDDDCRLALVGTARCAVRSSQRDDPTFRSFRMINCKNSSAVSAVRLSSGKFPWMPFCSSPPNGGLVRMTSTRSWCAASYAVFLLTYGLNKMFPTL